MIIDKDKIQKAKEKLGFKNGELMAQLLGIEDFNEKNTKALCPFHDEDTPSFIYNSKSFCFHCFGACHRNYDLIDVLMLKRHMTYAQAVQQLFEYAGLKYSFGEVGVATKHAYNYPKEIPINDKKSVKSYLATRGISPETIDYADVREDEHGNIVFNYYDANDVLTLVKYRPSRKVEKGEAKSWCQQGADTTPLLFNMNRINVEQPLVITEGECDTLSVIEAGWQNVVSVPFGAGNFTWIEENFDWLEQFDEIILCGDNDAVGQAMIKEVVSRLGSWRTKIAELPTEYVEPSTDKRRVIKDANEVLYFFGRDKLYDCLTNAKSAPVAGVTDLSDVEDMDIDSLDGIITGIGGIDQELMKIFYGTLTVLSGRPGAGKSSFIFQLASQALEQDKNVWIFSRELPNWMSKNWINYIMAGRHNLKKYQDSNNSIYYKVSPDAKAGINRTYKGRWYICNNDCSNKLDDLISMMTDVVRRYGVKLLIIDNLTMVDIGASENNELRKQTDAINKLIQFTTKYNVATILVAHPRKLQGDEEVGLYDVAGTSNIANLAHRTISLRRITKSEREGEKNSRGEYTKNPIPYDVMFSVIKDRMRGKSGFQYGLYYDVPSRRFYSNSEEFDYRYSWDKTPHPPLKCPQELQEDEVFGERTIS